MQIEVTHDHHDNAPAPPPNNLEVNVQSARVAEVFKPAAAQPHNDYLQSPLGPLGVAGVMHTGGATATGE